MALKRVELFIKKSSHFEKSLTVYKKDESKFSISIKKGFWFFYALRTY